MEEDEVVSIRMYGELKSLAVVPEIIDAKTGLPGVYFYNIMKQSKVLASTNPEVLYRLNPANADINSLDWSMLDRKVETRAAGDNINGLLSIVKKERTEEGDALAVTLKSNQSLDSYKSNEIAVVALRAVNKTNNEEYVSDYAKVGIEDLTQFAIINSKTVDMQKNTADKLYTALPALSVKEDATMLYNGELNLNDLVQTQATEISAITVLDKEPLANGAKSLNIDDVTYKFKKVDKYLGGDGTTDQQIFVNLDEKTGIVTPTQGTSGTGRTPVFMVEAQVNGETIATAYIKIRLTATEEIDQEDLIVTVNLGTIPYNDVAAMSKAYPFSWERMNTEVYDVLKLTNETFKANYHIGTITNEAGVDIKAFYSSSTNTTSEVAQLTFDATSIQDVEDKKDQTREATITYLANNNKVYSNVIIKFTYQIVDELEFPTLNKDYLIADNTIQVKGQLDGSKWVMKSALKEHCTDYLAGYTIGQAANNHTKLYANLTPMIPAQTGVQITGTDYYDQEIALTTELVGASKDYKVDMILVLANGEERTTTYTVRFVTPYTVTVDAVKLATLPAQPSTAELSKLFTIWGLKNEKVYTNGATTTDGKNIYKFDAAGMTATYALDGTATDSWASFGGRLTISSTGQISWYNQGNDLVNDKIAKSIVTVTIPDVAIIESTSTVTVEKSTN